MRKFIKIIIMIVLFVALLCIFINFGIIFKENKKIMGAAEAKPAQCALVLGCGVRADGTPSNMLYDRLEVGIELYKSGKADKLIMSGDHGRKNYDEVNVMKQFAIDRGVPSEDIFMDHAGFCTYDSIYRARDIFEVSNMVIVSQKYHLYRALYIADMLGVPACGVTADKRPYPGQFVRSSRELLARTKDFIGGIVKPKPKYLGEALPVNGNGNVTND